MENKDDSNELLHMHKHLALEIREKRKRAAELDIANKELVFQNEEKEKRAAELILANIRLIFENKEKEKRAAELIIANKELVFQNEEKEKRAAELIIANEELLFQNKEKGKRAIELVVAYEELAYQNREKENRATELNLANIELIFQNLEKEQRAAELIIANKELAFQRDEKGKRAAELTIANKELLFQNEEKEKRAAELIVANLELAHQNQEKEKARQVKLKNERTLARAQKIAHVGSWELSFIDNILHLSEEACRIFGCPEGKTQLSFEDWATLVHHEDLDFVLQKIRESRESLTETAYFHRIIQRDGTIRHIYSESKFEFDQENKVVGLYGITQDVTGIKLAEEKIEFEKNNLASLINNTNDPIWSVDTDFKLITSNQAFIELMNKITGKIIAKGNNVLLKDLGEKQLGQYKKFYERAFSGETFSEIIYTESPAECCSEVSFYPIRKAELVIGTACYSHDITERMRADKEREKMSADIIQRSKNLEQFSFIVSHNLRSPVANILGISNVLKGKITETDRNKLQNYLFVAVEKLDLIVKDLNLILQARSEINDKKETVYLPDLVESIELGFQNLIEKEEVKIDADFSHLNSIITIKGYIYSIFYNLISNSIKYRQPGRSPEIFIKSDIQDGKIKISFKDKGIGIDLKKHGEKIFGLYERFHMNIEGRGLGLYMIKTQLEILKGSITVKSEPNVGTEFIIELPA